MRKGDIKRTQILDTAERLFFERGYDRTSIQDILDEMNLSKGGFYHYFDAKETLLRELSERRALSRFDKLGVELYATRRSAIERLNLLLGLANLFETEDVHFAALMLKICYREWDPSISSHRRRILLDRLTPYVDEVIREGVEEGVLHTRHPYEIGRVLVMMACDVDDEACAILAAQPENPDRMLRVIELLNTWRDCAESLVGAPFGSLTLFDAGRLVSAYQAATDELIKLYA